MIDFYWFWNAGLASNFTMDVVHDVIDGEQRRMGSVKVFDPSLYLIWDDVGFIVILKGAGIHRSFQADFLLILIERTI